MIYRNSAPLVILENDSGSNLAADIYVNGRLSRKDVVTNKIDNIYQLQLTSSETVSDGSVFIEWKGYEYVVFSEEVVVSPIVSLARLQTLFGEELKTKQFLTELESSVRTIIEAYTGTHFGYFIGEKEVLTRGKFYILPDRLIKLAVGATLNLPPGPNEYYTIKQAPPGDLTHVTHGVIKAPPGRSKMVNTVRMIDGHWGYLKAPEDVQEAAMLLANDFICNDGIFHDRYIVSISNEMGSHGYHDLAFEGTGNSRADLLLKKYKVANPVWL